MIFRKFFIIIALLVSAPGLSPGQDVDHQLWVNYALTVPINTKWSYGGDTGIRGLVSNYDWNQFLIRPTLYYRINNTFRVSPAISWFHTNNKYSENVNELRIQQDLNINWPDLGFMAIFYRIRIEQRFFFFESEDLPNDFSMRVRGLVGIESADIRPFNMKRPIYFQVMYEGFATLKQEARETFVDQARLDLAVGHRISDRFRYELHFIRQASQLFWMDGMNVGQNIYRIRFFHRLAPARLQSKN